jgi:hypothetical protein
MTPVEQLAGWIPFRLYWDAGRPTVDWCYLGTRRFTEPFFEDTLAACLQLPFNLVFRRQTPVEVLAEWQALQPGLAPTGFIFHLSRCGSTLIAQMLAALRRNVVLSEAGPIHGVLRAPLRAPGVAAEQRRAWLRGMVSALGQRRRGDEQHLFIKFDCWSTLDLPLIRQAFPEVPWVFVYRDPVEVLVSHQSKAAAQMVPGLVEPAWLLGMPAAAAAELPREEYVARVLARIGDTACQEYPKGAGLLVNYVELPGAVLTRIADHFGLPLAAEDREKMRHAARFDAKNPHFEFKEDCEEKHRAATELVRQMAHTWVGPVYERLEAARQSHGLSLFKT